jgi:CDP-paratose 2-epimerase
MGVALITGSAGLVGAQAARWFHAQGLHVVGVDNDLRAEFFGPEASTAWAEVELRTELPNYRHYSSDIRDEAAIERVFREYSSDLTLVMHTAAQVSHDWAARDPKTDFGVNANGTLNLLEATRQHAPQAAFIFMSTNKVYGDSPNRLPLVERATRWELDPAHPFFEHGIDESMSLDRSLHSLFGVSKLAADALVQEYGRYFGMNTVCLRAGCITGPGHSAVALHGFLAYLAQCALTGTEYTIFGYGGKQVRDNLHAYDLVQMMWRYYQNPRPAEVYNVGGGRFSHCSLIEAVRLCESLTGRPMRASYRDEVRPGDHQFYVSDVRRFQAHYPDWAPTYSLERTLEEILTGLEKRLPNSRTARALSNSTS